ncbi:MAG TPA: CehA/McbA family metallohydrolase [Vicinamibacterales bacterium]|nr:CehA/McbA family metallohydrolase [Vicinamibacterales bacterium]
MTRRVFAILALSLSTAVLVAGPSRYGFSDRIERHLFPEVTTGPDNPTWSPDGAWIAFSMQGDIWKIPSKGGEAIALTKGPAYYFEPSWSPDGKSIAFTMDTDGNLDVGVVPADGGAVTRLTDAREVDLEPAWSRDSQDLYFVSARGGRGFDIFKLHVADRAVTPVVSDPGDQTQPAISPDGATLAYVSPVQGKLGTGGIWTRPLAGGQATLVHYEESEYRMRPHWTPDGKAFLYDSDDMGSNDVAIVPATGGNPFVITNDPMGELSPAPSPDGMSFAFVSNRTGPMTLEIAPIGGGPLSSWRHVTIASRRAAVPTGRVHGSVVDMYGAPMPARIEVKASDGRAYAPDGGFARVIAVSETHYFHAASGTFDLDVPAGPLAIEALRGFEYRPASSTVDVKAGTTANVTLTLRRLVDAPAMGWYGGDTHAHDLHQGRFGLTHKTLFDESLAEDLHLTNVLIHMDGTRIMGRWADLTGKPDPLSTPTHIMQFAEEFRGSLGHIGMIGIKTYVLPLTGGENNTAYAQVASDVPYLDGARAQGGLAGYMHPYTRASQNPAAPNPAQWDGSLIPVDVALGKGDFYDVESVYSDELGSAEMYYRLLNCGFRLAATGGTDNFPDVWRDPPPGTDRTYAKVSGPLSVASWLAAIKAGHTFGTTGPLIFLTVNGHEPGDEIKLADSAPATVSVKVTVQSIAPVDKLELIVNGVVQPAIPIATTPTYEGTVSIPAGGWVAARVVGPPSKHIADSYAFAQTTPVYVVRGGKPFVSQDDARFLAGVVDAIWARTMRSPWRSDAERAAFKAQIDQAKAVYVKLAGG